MIDAGKPTPLNDVKPDGVVEAVRADLLRRSQFGLAKYGISLERTDLTLQDWLHHAYEEALDSANYLKRAIMEIESQKAQLATAIGGAANRPKDPA